MVCHLPHECVLAEVSFRVSKKCQKIIIFIDKIVRSTYCLSCYTVDVINDALLLQFKRSLVDHSHHHGKCQYLADVPPPIPIIFYYFKSSICCRMLVKVANSNIFKQRTNYVDEVLLYPYFWIQDASRKSARERLYLCSSCRLLIKR